MNRFPSILIMLTAVSATCISATCSAAVKKPTSLKSEQPAAAQDAVAQAVTQLNQYATLQQSLKIQEPNLSYGMRKALMMADLLINADGTLNPSLCSSVSAAFVPAQPKEYEINMARVLSQLDASWQPFFANVKAPSDPTNVANTALRALFSLAPDTALTDRHAKVAVLAAMLAPYNQGPVGDCFAVCDVVRDHDEYYRHAAEDYQSIVMQGSIQRPINTTIDYFFFLPILADTDRDQAFSLLASGAFPNTSYSLFDAPGFAAARDVMGGGSISNLLSTVMQILAKSPGGDPMQVTPSQVISAIAQAVSAQTSGNASNLTDLGEYAFSSLTNNPILRGVESAFAAMAEDRATDSTRGNINSCIAQGLSPTWSSLSQMSGLSQFQQTFTNTFNASYHLLYNLNIPLAQVSADGSSTDGGFQLYERIPGNLSVIGNRIATPQQFRKLILDAVATTVTQLGSTLPVKAIAKKLNAVISTDAFLRSVFWAYDQSNQSEAHPVVNYLKLSRTPMQSCDGDNPFEVDDIDTEVSYDNHVQAYTPTNTNDLISWCLNIAKSATNDMTPMDSPQHAFNFMPKNPDIAAFIKNGMTASKWIQNMLVVSGMQVSKALVTADTAQAVGSAMYNFISNALPDTTSYPQLLQTLASQSLTVQSFAQQLLDGINKILQSTPDQANQVTVVLDGVLIQNLPANAQAIISQSAIRFAFTNWNQGAEDIYFCAYFNPRSEQVGFGSIFEDKTNLQPMDEIAWVNNQQWDVDLSPAAPVAN